MSRIELKIEWELKNILLDFRDFVRLDFSLFQKINEIIYFFNSFHTILLLHNQELTTIFSICKEEFWWFPFLIDDGKKNVQRNPWREIKKIHKYNECSVDQCYSDFFCTHSLDSSLILCVNRHDSFVWQLWM